MKELGPLGPALVQVLLGARGPSAVARLVVAVVVDAVDCQLTRRSPTHVGEEVLEGSPALADPNPATAVVFVVGGVLIQATSEHVTPCLVFFRRAAAKILPVNYFPATAIEILNLQAAATLRQTSDNAITERREYFAAIAATPPSRLPVVVDPVELNHGHHVEPLASEVPAASLLAATASCLAAPEGIAVHGRDAPAGAVTEPFSLPSVIEPIERENGQKAEHLSNHIFTYAHGGILT